MSSELTLKERIKTLETALGRLVDKFPPFKSFSDGGPKDEFGVRPDAVRLTVGDVRAARKALKGA